MRHRGTHHVLAARRGPRPLLAVASLCCALAATAPATAHAQGAPLDGLHLALRAHHTAPPAAALEQLATDLVAALRGVIGDEHEPMLVRRRAVLVLAELPDPRAEVELTDLISGSPHGALRRASARALTRRLADRDPGRLVALLSDLLRSRDPDDRETAVWLLARVDAPAARERLARQRVVERHRAVVDALRRVASGRISRP